jgi:hypothetical protein
MLKLWLSIKKKIKMNKNKEISITRELKDADLFNRIEFM